MELLPDNTFTAVVYVVVALLLLCFCAYQCYNYIKRF